jgi:hypothetical protein
MHQPAAALHWAHSHAVVSPLPRRSLPVVPLIGDKRYYGEAPARVLWGYGVGAGGRGHYATHYLENSEEPRSSSSHFGSGREFKGAGGRG